MSGRSIRLQLVLDFDGTITLDDTTAVIGAICLAKARELAPDNVPHDRLPKSMEYYGEQYMKDLHEWKQSLPSDVERKSIEDEISHISESRHIEVASYSRVRTAVLNVPGDVSRISQDHLYRDDFMVEAGRQAVRGGEVRIRDRDSLARLVEKAEAPGSTWAVVSVSWSRRFILGALIEAGLVQETQQEGIAPNIRCNELLAPTALDEGSDMLITCSAKDKRDDLSRLLGDWMGNQSLQADGHSNEILTVYVGDSSTDIGCLTGPAIGVLMLNEDPEKNPVVQTLRRFGVECIRLPESTSLAGQGKMNNNGQKRASTSQAVYLANGFHEIDAWLSELLKYPTP